jgi:hypothetical protein
MLFRQEKFYTLKTQVIINSDIGKTRHNLDQKSKL